MFQSESQTKVKPKSQTTVKPSLRRQCSPSLRRRCSLGQSRSRSLPCCPLEGPTGQSWPTRPPPRGPSFQAPPWPSSRDAPVPPGRVGYSDGDDDDINLDDEHDERMMMIMISMIMKVMVFLKNCMLKIICQ